MKDILEAFKDEKELFIFFSDLVNQYFKLSGMRVMQIIREKYNLPHSEMPNLITAIYARQMNEACYCCCGLMIGSGLKLEEMLPKETIALLGNLLDGKLSDPKLREDIDINVGAFKKFLTELTEETDLRL